MNTTQDILDVNDILTNSLLTDKNTIFSTLSVDDNYDLFPRNLPTSDIKLRKQTQDSIIFWRNMASQLADWRISTGQIKPCIYHSDGCPINCYQSDCEFCQKEHKKLWIINSKDIQNMLNDNRQKQYIYTHKYKPKKDKKPIIIKDKRKHKKKEEIPSKPIVINTYENLLKEVDDELKKQDDMLALDIILGDDEIIDRKLFTVPDNNKIIKKQDIENIKNKYVKLLQNLTNKPKSIKQSKHKPISIFSTLSVSEIPKNLREVKTQLCKSVIKHEKCKHKKCKFAHNISELKVISCRKNRLCKHIEYKNDKYYNKLKPICPYLHPNESMINYFQRIGYDYLNDPLYTKKEYKYTPKQVQYIIPKSTSLLKHSTWSDIVSGNIDIKKGLEKDIQIDLDKELKKYKQESNIENFKLELIHSLNNTQTLHKFKMNEIDPDNIEKTLYYYLDLLSPPKDIRKPEKIIHFSYYELNEKFLNFLYQQNKNFRLRLNIIDLDMI